MSVSLIKIGRTLNEVPDVGTCCCSTNINKWSFHKPINVETNLAISDSVIYANNDGFNLYRYPSPQQLVYALQNINNTGLWEYAEREEPFRLTDFDQYDHYATPLYSLEFVTGNSGTAGTALRITCSDDLENFIDRWAYFEGIRSYATIYALIYPKGTLYDNVVNRGIGIYKLASKIDGNIDSDHLSFVIPQLSVGTYELRVCISNSTDVTNYMYYTGEQQLTGYWYALPPESVLTFNVNSSGGGGGGTPDQPSTNFFNYVEWTFDRLSYDWNDPNLTNINFRARIMLNVARGDVKVETKIYYNPNDLPQGTSVMLGQFTRILNLEDIIYEYVNISYAGPITTMTGAHLGDGELGIQIQAKITYNSTSQTKTWTENIEM